MSYTGTTIKDLDVATPAEGCTPAEINDSDREIKTVLKNQFAVITGRTTALTLAAGHFIVICDASGGAFSITLPTIGNVCSATFTKLYLIIKSDSSANAITVVGTVSGAVDPTLTKQYDALLIAGDGTSWHKIHSYQTDLLNGTLDGGTIGGTTAPTVYGKAPVISSAGNITLTAAQCYGTIVRLTAAGTVTLPAGATGMNLIIRPCVAAVCYADPNGTEAFVLNGTSLTGGYKIKSSGAWSDDIALYWNGAAWDVMGLSIWTSNGS